MPSSVLSSSNTHVLAMKPNSKSNQDSIQDKGNLSESAFSGVFLIHTKSGFNNPSALVRDWDGNDT